jgi:hypothetical protein
MLQIIVQLLEYVFNAHKILIFQVPLEPVYCQLTVILQNLLQHAQ